MNKCQNINKDLTNINLKTNLYIDYLESYINKFIYHNFAVSF